MYSLGHISPTFTAHHHPERLPMAYNFAILSWSGTNTAVADTIICQSDIPCHLYVRWSLVANQVHMEVSQTGKYQGRERPYYCFVAWHGIEQIEPGNTILHTFIVPIPTTMPCIYFGFVGLVSGHVSPSSTAIFKYCPTIGGPGSYFGTGYPYMFPLVLSNDCIIACMWTPNTMQCGCWKTADFGVTWTHLLPAQQPVCSALQFAWQFPLGWLFAASFGTWISPTATRVYSAPSFNGVWSELTANSFSPLFSPFIQLIPQTPTSNVFWFVGRRIVSGGSYTLWYASGASLQPVVWSVNTWSNTPYEFKLNATATAALWNTYISSSIPRPIRSLVSPFGPSSWVGVINPAVNTFAQTNPPNGILPANSQWGYTTDNWVHATIVNFPTSLVGLGSAITATEVVRSTIHPLILLAVSNNAHPIIARSINFGTTWATVHTNLTLSAKFCVNRIGFFNTQPTWAWCLSGTGFWVSKDEGVTWVNYSNNLGI